MTADYRRYKMGLFALLLLTVLFALHSCGYAQDARHEGRDVYDATTASVGAAMAIPAKPRTLFAVMDRITDGDTVRVKFPRNYRLSTPDGTLTKKLIAGKAYRVRLRMVDAPEYDVRRFENQNGGKEARDAAGRLFAAWRKIRLVDVAVDPEYPDRLIAFVQRANCEPDRAECDAGFLLLRAGHLWHAPNYAKSEVFAGAAQYAAAESSARIDGNGLWQDSKCQVSPWDWRKGKRCAEVGQ